MDWEMPVIIGLTVILVASFAFGSIWNRRIQKAFWNSLKKALKRYTRRVSYKGLGSSGFKVAFRPSSGPLKKVEVTLILLAREMPPYLLAAYALGRRDRMIFKANVVAKPTFHFEALGPRTSLRGEIKLKMEALKPVKAGGLSKYITILSDKPDLASELLKKGLFDKLVELRECLERFSISKTEPHVLLVCRRQEEAIGKAFSLIEKAGDILRELSDIEKQAKKSGKRKR